MKVESDIVLLSMLNNFWKTENTDHFREVLRRDWLLMNEFGAIISDCSDTWRWNFFRELFSLTGALCRECNNSFVNTKKVASQFLNISEYLDSPQLSRISSVLSSLFSSFKLGSCPDGNISASPNADISKWAVDPMWGDVRKHCDATVCGSSCSRMSSQYWSRISSGCSLCISSTIKYDT